MASNNRKCILIVDDSDITRNSLKIFFEDYNMEVITCNDGLEGIEKVLEYKPNLIFLDLLMPNLNGVKMLKVMKVIKEVKNIPVIVISGNTNKHNVLAAIESGAEKVLSKPLSKEVIIKNVNEILGENTLQNEKKNPIMNDEDNLILKVKLLEFFMRSFPEKKRAIEEGVVSKNKELLNVVLHEMKGSGGLIGYPDITILAQRLMNKLSQPRVNWNFIKFELDELFSIINDIKFPKGEFTG